MSNHVTAAGFLGRSIDLVPYQFLYGTWTTEYSIHHHYLVLLTYTHTHFIAFPMVCSFSNHTSNLKSKIA
jgi:hypothetical protein